VSNSDRSVPKDLTEFNEPVRVGKRDGLKNDEFLSGLKQLL